MSCRDFFSIDEKLFCSDNSKLFFFQSRKIESIDIARSKRLAGIDRSGFYCFGYCNVRAMISTFSHDSNNSAIKTAIGSNNSNKLKFDSRKTHLNAPPSDTLTSEDELPPENCITLKTQLESRIVIKIYFRHSFIFNSECNNYSFVPVR